MSDESKFKEAISEMNAAREAHGLEVYGGKYSQVKDRVEVFRKLFGSDYGIDTEIKYQTGFRANDIIVIKATVTDKVTGRIMAAGHATEVVGSNHVSSVAPIEACETSAIGRALASFGLHGGEFASGNEMGAVDRKKEGMHNHNQQQPEPPKPTIKLPQNFYIPVPDDPTWNDILACHNNVLCTLDLVENEAQLGAYWAAINEYRRYAEGHTEKPELYGEMVEYFRNTKARIQGNHNE